MAIQDEPLDDEIYRLAKPRMTRKQLRMNREQAQSTFTGEDWDAIAQQLFALHPPVDLPPWFTTVSFSGRSAVEQLLQFLRQPGNAKEAHQEATKVAS